MEHSSIYKIRHSLAHLLAMAALDKYPDAKLSIGPVIDNGFYYDIDFGDHKVGEDDLKQFQKTIKKLAGRGLDFARVELSNDAALEMFSTNEYKTELINELIAKGEELSFYQTGDDFVDLCAGGHIDNTSEIDTSAFRLERVAGAYWRGDENNKMLTRIYGVAFENKEELQQHDEMMREAAKRDHRKLGKELGLFTMSELIGPGLPLFTPKGTIIRELITNKIWSLQSKLGWERVCTPHITKQELYETSGHWDKFGDELFKVRGKNDAEFVMKPMNCPHHTQIFSAEMRSYKDLPMRFAENGVVYRDEQAGELIGLSRVRSITQDDGHCFCTPEQIEQEVGNIVEIIKDFYTALGMFEEGKYWVSLSAHDPNEMDKYLGTSEQWEHSEQALANIAEKLHLNYKKIEGEAAFYGPKLDFMFFDALGRERQLATAQLDFMMPERFNLEYTDKNGERKTPVMIHRAIAGSLERFMAVMIEHFAGNFPFWLSPTQVSVIPVNIDAHGEQAAQVYQALKSAGIRVEFDAQSKDGMGKQVRHAKKQKYPYWIIIGDTDIENGVVTLESRDSGENEQISLEDLITKFQAENQ